MSDVVLWIHDDILSPEAPPFRAYPGAPALYVFDDQYLREHRWSLKRIVFIYECLIEMPVAIDRGDPAEQVRRFADGRRIVTTASPNPRVRELAAQMGEVEFLPADPFVEIPEPVDLKRFTRYWKKAEPLLFAPAVRDRLS